MKRARLLAFVLTAAMATSVFLGGTVARYQTTATIGDEATVAKWGVKLTMAGNLYDKNYKEGVISSSIPTTSDSGISVKAEDAKNRVAPGTKGDNLKIALTGKTEVDVKVELDITAQDVYLGAGTYAIMQKVTIDSENAMDSMIGKLYILETSKYRLVTDSDPYSDDYKDLGTTSLYIKQNEVTVTGTGYYPMAYSGGTTATSITGIADELADKVVASNDTNTTSKAIAEYDVENVYAENYVLDGIGLNDVDISWTWDFENSSSAIVAPNEVNDADTILGALAFGTQTVVMLNGDGTTYSTIAVESELSGLVKTSGGSGDEVGSVKTSFSITLTVSQED